MHSLKAAFNHSRHDSKHKNSSVPSSSSSSVVPNGVATAEPALHSPVADPVSSEALAHETIVKPEVVHATAKNVEQEIVTPVLQRDREHTEIRQVVQPIADQQVNVTQNIDVVDNVQEKMFKEEMSAENKALYNSNAALQNQSSTLDTTRTQTVQPTQVHENLHKKIIEEIQPLIQREIINPTVINRTVPVHETVVHAPTVTSEIRPTLSMADFLATKTAAAAAAAPALPRRPN